MLTAQELELVRKALKALKVDRCKAIDSVKKTVGKDDPAYQRFAGEYYEEIRQADDLLDRLKATATAG